MEPRRKFRFLRELATGGFGRVYLAETLSGDNFSTAVAIKLLHGRWLTNDEIVMRSRDEARLLGKLRHKNIVRVEDLTSINGQIAIVMEYLDGVDLRTLAQWLRDQGRIFPRQAAFEVAAGVAAALDAAYATVPIAGGEPLRVIHRDIKPSNVMLTRDGEVKVLDFGTARATFAEREAKTQALAFGSTAYMAPERHLGDDDTAASDVFSLGVLLWELLALEGYGRIQVRHERFEEVRAERLAALDLAAFGASAEAARALVGAMLAWAPEDRPGAGEARDRLEHLAEEVRDGSLRRLARDSVRVVQEASPPPVDPHDALAGVTVTEDLRLAEATAAHAVRGIEPGRTFDAGAPGEAEPVFLPPPPDRALPRAPSAPRPAGPSARSIDTIPPDIGAVSNPGRPWSGPPVAPVPALGTPLIGEPPRPPPVDLPGPPPPALPSGPTPTLLRPVGERSVLDEELAPPPRRWGWAVAVGLVALLGAGAATAVGMGWWPIHRPQPVPPVPAEAPLPVDPPRPGLLVPDWTPPAPGLAAVLLEVPGGAEVGVVSSAGFRTTWDGTGVLRVGDVGAGVYRTRVKAPGAAGSVRSDLVAEADRVCSFRWNAERAAWDRVECR